MISSPGWPEDRWNSILSRGAHLAAPRDDATACFHHPSYAATWRRTLISRSLFFGLGDRKMSGLTPLRGWGDKIASARQTIAQALSSRAGCASRDSARMRQVLTPTHAQVPGRLPLHDPPGDADVHIQLSADGSCRCATHAVPRVLARSLQAH